MNKFSVFFLLMALSAVIAGVFGALHNQLSYTVGAAYFHELKFAQFAISDGLHNRLGAALVGWRASWWMGLLVGLPIMGLGFFLIARPKTLLIVGIGAIGTVFMVTTLAVAAGLAFGVVRLDPELVAALPIPQNISDPMGFARAGIMHDMAYYGAIAGGVIGLWTIWKARRLDEAPRGA